MIQSSLGPVILYTVGDVTNTSGTSTVGIVQGSSCSPPLFNIFIDPLAELLHATAVSLPDEPRNALLADDVAVYARRRTSLQALLDVCSDWARQFHVTWNAGKSQILINEESSSYTHTFTLAGETLLITTSVQYLGGTLTSRGIRASKSLKRTESAFQALRRLLNTGVVNPVLHPQRVSQIFTTFIRSKYVYALAHVPLSQ